MSITIKTHKGSDSSDLGINQEGFKPYIRKPYKVRVCDDFGYDVLKSFETVEEQLKFALSFGKTLKSLDDIILVEL